MITLLGYIPLQWFDQSQYLYLLALVWLLIWNVCFVHGSLIRRLNTAFLSPSKYLFIVGWSLTEFAGRTEFPPSRQSTGSCGTGAWCAATPRAARCRTPPPRSLTSSRSRTSTRPAPSTHPTVPPHTHQVLSRHFHIRKIVFLDYCYLFWTKLFAVNVILINCLNRISSLGPANSYSPNLSFSPTSTSPHPQHSSPNPGLTSVSSPQHPPVSAEQGSYNPPSIYRFAHFFSIILWIFVNFPHIWIIYFFAFLRK